MTAQSILEDTKIFLEHLGLREEPFGVYYDTSDRKKRSALNPVYPFLANWKIRGS
jgi:hypothetical protein